MAGNRAFFAKHAKSSAVLISVALHALIFILALTFVVVQVIQKDDADFQAKTVARPHMPLKKLQVPVTVKKKRPKPKLRKRIVVKKMNQNMPDIKMPEITGVKGGLGNAKGSGLGGASLGFTMPEIELFGIKDKGEKIFIILDSTPWIMYDELGGIPAYVLIKDELIRILGELNPTVLFNVAVYGHGTGSYTLFPRLVPASEANVAKIQKWLDPLNSVKAGGYGTHTLGPGGSRIEGDLVVEPLKNVNHWSEPTMYAMQLNVDTVFLLTSGWGHIVYNKTVAKPWSEANWERYREIERKATEKLAEENRRRAANGQPERVLVGFNLIETYFPGTQHPPQPERHWYTGKELVKAFVTMRESSNVLGRENKSGLKKKSSKRAGFTFNVIQFVQESGAVQEDRFKELTGMLGGEYRMLPGLAAIKSYLDSSD